MDVREKLFTLFQDCNNPSWKWFPNNAEMMKLIEYLISHGVTVQEWISVKDRLPEDSANVLVCHKNGFVTTNAWLGAHWWFKNERNPITHWMPLPQPPKGE